MKHLKPQWFQILLAIADGEKHGLAIMTEVLDNTGGRMRLWPAMLYGSLKDMSEQGLITETDGPPDSSDIDRRRFYKITAAGRSALQTELSQLRDYISLAKRKRVPLEES